MISATVSLWSQINDIKKNRMDLKKYPLYQLNHSTAIWSHPQNTKKGHWPHYALGVARLLYKEIHRSLYCMHSKVNFPLWFIYEKKLPISLHFSFPGIGNSQNPFPRIFGNFRKIDDDFYHTIPKYILINFPLVEGDDG